MLKKIESNRLYLLPCDLKIINIVLQGDQAIQKELGLTVPAQWTEFGLPAFEYTKTKLTEDSTQLGWWTYLPILKKGNVLLGSGGYQGAPIEGVVEIGYEVALEYRGQGFATEIAKCLLDHAFAHPSVQKVVAHTLAEDNASTKVLKKNGMKKVETIIDPEEGPIWKWELLAQI